MGLSLAAGAFLIVQHSQELIPTGLALMQRAAPDEGPKRRARAGLPPLRAYACQLATTCKAAVVLPEMLK